ncbi:MAG: hypothetical protein ACE5FM_06995 [Methyloligellaceae bacterium]
MKRTLFRWACVIALGLGLAPYWALSVAAQDTKQKKSPSDRTVRVIMGWAFAAVPEKIKTKDGKEITIDRSDPSKFMIPIEDARRVIRVAMRSTNAKLCDLPKLEGQNFRKMMAKEKALGKWSPNQIRFIKMLHISAGLVITGGFTLGKKAEGKDEEQNDKRKKYNCSAEEHARVKASIEAYLKEPDKPQ